MLVMLLSALSWSPHVKGGLYVLIAVVILPGSAYLLLATNTGARLGFQLAAAGLFGFMVIIGVVWWVYGIGPKGPEPTWKAQSIVTGDPARAPSATLSGFPKGWKTLDVADPEVADAQPVVDSRLAGKNAPFEKSADYLVIGAFKKGGENYGPLGLNFRPLDLFHKPHFLMVQVQKVQGQEAPAGAPPPKPVLDTSVPPVAVLMVRDLGHERREPAIATLASLLIFAVLVYQLHTRDKEAMAARA